MDTNSRNVKRLKARRILLLCFRQCLGCLGLSAIVKHEVHTSECRFLPEVTSQRASQGQ